MMSKKTDMDADSLLAPAPIHVEVRLDGRHVRAFHRLLLKRLAEIAGVSISCDVRPAASPRLPGADALFQLETLIHGLPDCGAVSRIDAGELGARIGDPAIAADLVIDLCGDATARGGRLWLVSYDGGVGEDALLASILDGRSPLVTISQEGTIVAAARPGTDNGGIVVAAFQDMLVRTVSLIAGAVAGAAIAPPPRLPDAEPSLDPVRMPSGASIAAVAAKQVARRIVQRIYHLCYHAPHWRVGWRRRKGPGLATLRAHPDQGWQVLPDDGRRFYADPFPISHQGRVTLFVEDYAHGLGKGVISAVAFGPQGPLGRPQPVLELPYHLSYPFVFEREGAVWMIPESCANGTVDLYRASAFPTGWVKEATLLSGIVASDATLVEHGGRWWMFATVRDAGGAFSDALHLWTAPDFRGPWTPHPRNPVLIDIASARPAGRVIRRGNDLLRPVQDCRAGYGAALGLARIVRLDDDGFEQSIEAIISPGALWPGRKLHTLNDADDLEFIDGSALSPRWTRWSRT